jgi:hypothetical protein
LSIEIEKQNEVSKKWERQSYVIESYVDTGKVKTESASWFPHDRSVQVSETPSALDIFLNIGRLRGKPVQLVEIMLLQNTDVEKYELSKGYIDKFRSAAEIKKTSDTSTLQTIGTVVYEQGTFAFVVESKHNNQIIERYWIDATRGYVCPLIQYYDEGGSLTEEYKGKEFFLHEKSGLWFPAIYSEKKTDHNGGISFSEYKINIPRLDVNFQVFDKDFAFDIPIGTKVIDTRNGVNKQYRSSEIGTLSLAEGGLDLEKKDWLYGLGTLPQIRRGGFYYRFVFFVISIIILVLAYFLLTRKKRTKHQDNSNF